MAQDLRSTTPQERRPKASKNRRKGDRRKSGFDRRAAKFDKDKSDENYGYGPLSSTEYGEK